MAPQYKLIYFDTAGRGELIRVLLHFAGVEFEDYRMSREEWPKLKPEMPFGQVPVLEVDGKKLSQSLSIARFVASKYGLTGNDAWDAALCDQYVDALTDVLNYLVVWMYTGKNQEEKDAAKKTLFETALPDLCERMTRAIEKNPSGLLVCDKVTWADIYLAVGGKALAAEPGAFDKFPAVLALQQKVFSDPRLKGYLEKAAAAKAQA